MVLSMDIFIRIINLYFIFILGRFILNVFIAFKMNSKISKEKDIDKSNYRNSWHERVDNIKKETNMLEMVKDEVCGTYLEREKAYQLVEDERTLYFCSWACRKKYIDEKNKKQ